MLCVPELMSPFYYDRYLEKQNCILCDSIFFQFPLAKKGFLTGAPRILKKTITATRTIPVNEYDLI